MSSVCYFHVKPEMLSDFQICISAPLKIKFLFSYVLAFFINLTDVTTMLLIMAKLSTIFKPECVTTSDFLLLLKRELKGITILP